MGDPMPPPPPPVSDPPRANVTAPGNPRTWPAAIIVLDWLVSAVAAGVVNYRSDNPPVSFFEEHAPWDATPLLLVILIQALAVTAIVAALVWCFNAPKPPRTLPVPGTTADPDAPAY